MMCDVVQYLHPNGRKSPQQVELSDDITQEYERMKAAGYRLAAEVLTTGTVSVTIENSDKDLDMRIVANGPGVVSAYEDMLRKHFADGRQ